MFFCNTEMKPFFLILFICCTAQGFSQMLRNSEGQSFGDKPEFDFDFIRGHKIKSITGRYSTKAERDYIRSTTDVITYNFNRAGELSYEYKIQGNDTIVTVYVYDEYGNVVTKRKSDRYSFVSYHYAYDKHNRLISTEMRRDENRGQDRLTFEPGQHSVVSSERFDYVDFDNGDYKKIFYNESGGIYLEEFFYFDDKQQLIRQEGTSKSGAGRITTTYSYDKDGRLLQKFSESTMMGNYTARHVYEYDAHGNILAQRYYKDGNYTTEFQILYDETTHELKAIITRDHATNFMTILTLKEYTYF